MNCGFSGFNLAGNEIAFYFLVSPKIGFKKLSNNISARCLLFQKWKHLFWKVNLGHIYNQSGYY